MMYQIDIFMIYRFDIFVKCADFEICFANTLGALRLQQRKKQLEDYSRKHSVFPRSRQSLLIDKHNKARKQVNLLRAYYAEREFAAQLLMRGLAPNK